MAVSARIRLQPGYIFSCEANQAINITHLAPPRSRPVQGQQQTSLQGQLWQQHQQLLLLQQQQQQQMGMPQPFTYNPFGVAATNSYPAGFAPFQFQAQSPFAPQQQRQQQIGMNMAIPQDFSHNSPGLAATKGFSADPAPFPPQPLHQIPPELPPQNGFQQQQEQHFMNPAPAPQPQQQPFPVAPAATTPQPKRKRGRPSHASLGKLTAKEKRAIARAAVREPPAVMPVFDLPDFIPVVGPVGVPGDYNPFLTAAQNAGNVQQDNDTSLEALAEDAGIFQQGDYNADVEMLDDDLARILGDYNDVPGASQDTPIMVSDDDNAFIPAAKDDVVMVQDAHTHLNIVPEDAVDPELEEYTWQPAHNNGCAPLPPPSYSNNDDADGGAERTLEAVSADLVTELEAFWKEEKRKEEEMWFEELFADQKFEGYAPEMKE